ncbi:unnamed protein product [Rotaria magnacalcarata]|uniref:VWFC domain-containing protein n=2 Tax=Rotaria magnacalcarata TaxID=392030 RepID=A0A816TSY0_9BILA|nr:unnamed protein product [Rotaria magnacalcarata]CAF2104963.1 unnamed protein product [Rotaria magnacalcarata]CAF4724492.1 unnamed protein product [Rotaria magnacalcarata]
MVDLRAVIFVAVLMALAIVVIQGDSEESNTSSSHSPLERAVWCRTRNNTYLALGGTYMQSMCTMCICTSSRIIRCARLECMPTYCVDNSAPIRKNGQCCTQCAYDQSYGNQTTCVSNGITYPHGALIKSVENKMNCWCQMGNIECRSHSIGPMQALDIFSDTATIYIVVMVVMIVLIVGLLLCCSCTLASYYYYQRYQRTMQQQYEEYVNSAGWQPLGDEEHNAADMSAEEKRIEAEKFQSTLGITEMVPPPYGVYNNSFVHADEQKQH